MIFLKQRIRLFAFLMAAALLLLCLLPGCGGTADSPETSSTTTEPTQTSGTTAMSAAESTAAAPETLPLQEDTTDAAQTSPSTAAAAAQPTIPVKDDRTQAPAVLTYVKNTQDILNSQKYTLKGTVTAGSETGAFVMVSDGDRAAAELPIALFAQAPELSAFAAMGQYFGKTVRLVMLPNRMLMVFPEKSRYLNVEDEVPADSFTDLTDYLSDSALLKNTKTATAQLNGKTHEVATLADADGEDIARLYYLNGELRRIEALGESDSFPVIDITSLTAAADASYFATDNLLPIDLQSLQALGGGMPTLW